jgi:glycosyl transferase, family 25
MMKRLIEAFDRAYVINLQDRADRRRDVKREFKKIGADIPSDKVRFYTAVRPADQGEFPSLGARGVFTSHRDILDLAIGEGLRNVLVFEDDVSFRSVQESLIMETAERLFQQEWDIVLFGYYEPAGDNLPRPLVPWRGRTLGTHFYGVNGRFMGKMLRYMRDCEARPRNHPEGPTSADGIYNRVRLTNPDVRVFLASPMLAYQRSSRSDIRPGTSYDKFVWLEPMTRCARSIKHRLRMRLDWLMHRLNG